MRPLVLNFILLTGVCLVSSDIQPRHLLNFYDMIKATTGRGPLLYSNYGNWCGVGGKGEPVDGTDTCCREHDFCYDRITKKECSGLMGWLSYFESYTFNATEGQIVCIPEKDTECGKVLCQCDRTAAICFGNNEYHPEHSHFSK